MEFPKVTTKDWAEVVRTSTGGPLNIVHGTTAGNIVELQMPSIQPGPFTLQDDASNVMMTMPFDVNPVVGNDELVVIVR